MVLLAAAQVSETGAHAALSPASSFFNCSQARLASNIGQVPFCSAGVVLAQLMGCRKASFPLSDTTMFQVILARDEITSIGLQIRCRQTHRKASILSSAALKRAYIEKSSFNSLNSDRNLLTQDLNRSSN